VLCRRWRFLQSSRCLSRRGAHPDELPRDLCNGTPPQRWLRVNDAIGSCSCCSSSVKGAARELADFKTQPEWSLCDGAYTARHRSRRCPRCSDDRRCHAQWIRYPTTGIPRLADGKPNLGMIIQASSVKIILYEEATTFRQFFLDGRKLPDDRQPTWEGLFRRALGRRRHGHRN
jgi:hypothetical protein